VHQVLECAGAGGGFIGGCANGRLEAAISFLFARGAVTEGCALLPAFTNAGRTTDNRKSGDAQGPMGGSDGRSVVGPNETCPTAVAAGGLTCLRLSARLPSTAERLLVRIWPGGPAGALAARGEHMIRTIILTYAAVASIVHVYADFLSYRGGVYHGGPHGGGGLRGVTAVQLLGWGGDGTMPYWIGENSFGVDWGEGGYFRWLRGENHLGIEQRALFGLVEGLLPISDEGGGTEKLATDGGTHDRYQEFSARTAVAEQELSTVKAQNWCLALSASIMLGLATLLSLRTIRHCFCTEEDESAGSEDSAQMLRANG